MKKRTVLLAATLLCLGLTACATKPSSEADRANVRKAERIADRMGPRP